MLTGLGLFAQPAQAAPVTVPDKNLEAALRSVLQDPKGKPKTALSSAARERVAAIATELAKRLQLD